MAKLDPKSNFASQFAGVQLLSLMEILLCKRLHGLPLVPRQAYQLSHTPKQCCMQYFLGVNNLQIFENWTFNVSNSDGAHLEQSPDG